jgi:hypothetical protein
MSIDSLRPSVKGELPTIRLVNDDDGSVTMVTLIRQIVSGAGIVEEIHVSQSGKPKARQSAGDKAWILVSRDPAHWCGQSLRDIADECGVSHSALSRSATFRQRFAMLQRGMSRGGPRRGFATEDGIEAIDDGD